MPYQNVYTSQQQINVDENLDDCSNEIQSEMDLKIDQLNNFISKEQVQQIARETT
jgi:hypothetical protein